MKTVFVLSWWWMSIDGIGVVNSPEVMLFSTKEACEVGRLRMLAYLGTPLPLNVPAGYAMHAGCEPHKVYDTAP